MSDLAIIIPTMNRAELLLGQLFFYNSFGLDVSIYIGDSSNEDQKAIIRHGLQDIKNIKVDFVDFPASDMQVKVIIDLIKRVREEYITVSGDDDYHYLPTSLKCIEFLKKNPTYALCTGSVAMIESKLENDIRRIISSSDYSPKTPIISESPLERIKLLSKHYYLPLFCIGRKKDFVEAFITESKIPSNIIWAETLPAFKLIASGNFQILDGLAMIRGTHPERPNYKNGIRDTFLNDDWSYSLKVAIKSLTTYLKEQGIEEEGARHNLLDTFSEYYSKQIAMQASEVSHVKNIKKRIPGPLKSILKSIYFRMNSNKLNGGSIYPYSKYYKVFKTLSECFIKASQY